jgi:hypothetical protein
VRRGESGERENSREAAAGEHGRLHKVCASVMLQMTLAAPHAALIKALAVPQQLPALMHPLAVAGVASKSSPRRSGDQVVVSVLQHREPKQRRGLTLLLN